MAVGEVTTRELDRLLGLVEGVRRFRIEERRRLELQDGEGVSRELASLRIEDGWLTLTDRVLTFTAPTEISSVAWEGNEGGGAASTPLEGELRLDETTSVHLRHLGEARWSLTWLHRVDDPEGCGTHRKFFAAGVDGVSRLRYEVEWRLAEDVFGQPVLRPFRSRFTGFEMAKGRDA